MQKSKNYKPLLLSHSLRIIIISLSFSSFAVTDAAQAQEKILRTITVTGEGVERIPTTLTRVQLGVEIQGKTATEVQQEVARRTSKVVEFLRSRNVQQLQTTGIQLQPNYDYRNNERRLVGYVGTNTVSFRLNTEQVGNLLDEAVNRGATRIDGVSFTATETAISAAQKQALTEATQDAQQQAEAVLKTLNLTPKEILSIQINGASPPQPILLRAEQLAMPAANSSTPVIGGEQSIRGSVTLQVSY